MEQTGNALVSQGIEHRFPKPNYGAQASPRKPSRFLTITGKWPRPKAVGELGNHLLFATIPGNCCAEVVLGILADFPIHS